MSTVEKSVVEKSVVEKSVQRQATQSQSIAPKYRELSNTELEVVCGGIPVPKIDI